MNGRGLAITLVISGLLVGALALVGAPGLFGTSVAHAQPAGKAEAPRPVIRKLDNRPNLAPPAEDKGTAAAANAPDDKRRPGNSKPVALFFWLFALATIGGAVFVITRRNLISAVMGMVGTFFAVAALYAMLYAHFLAVIQVLVYAGAIMVLFVFVIMMLNRPVEEPWSQQGVVGKWLAVVAALYLFVRLFMVLWPAEPARQAAGLAPGKTIDGFDFGSVRAVGTTLFHEYLFPFEAVSIVLLIAIVGALMVARPHAKRGAADSASAGSEAAAGGE